MVSRGATKYGRLVVYSTSVRKYAWEAGESVFCGFFLYNVLVFRMFQLKFCGRKTSAAVAVGFAKVHQEEVAEILSRPFSYNELQ